MQKINWKKTAIAATALFCIGGASAGVAVAWFTDEAMAVNSFRTGVLQVGLQETDWDPEEGDGRNLYPGYSVYKNPTIKNVVSDAYKGQSVYARMIVTIKDRKGAAIEEQASLDLICQTIRYDETYTGTYLERGEGTKIIQGWDPGYSLSALKDIPMVNPLFVLDEERSEKNVLVYNYMGKDGKGILNTGEEAALFTDLVIPLDWSWEELEQVGDFVLDISQESIQSAGFDSQKEAFLALDASMAEGRENV
jgi:hypothetical protein